MLRPRPANTLSTLLVSISCNDPKDVVKVSNSFRVSSLQTIIEGWALILNIAENKVIELINTFYLYII